MYAFFTDTHKYPQITHEIWIYTPEYGISFFSVLAPLRFDLHVEIGLCAFLKWVCVCVHMALSSLWWCVCVCVFVRVSCCSCCLLIHFSNTGCSYWTLRLFSLFCCQLHSDFFPPQILSLSLAVCKPSNETYRMLDVRFHSGAWLFISNCIFFFLATCYAEWNELTTDL